MNTIWVFIIIRPLCWVGFNVTGNPVHFGFVADDPLVIIPLPDNLTFGSRNKLICLVETVLNAPINPPNGLRLIGVGADRDPPLPSS
jgi:hypothetical protein